MKPKRGQVTIFIIVAIVIIAMVAVIFYFSGGIKKAVDANAESANTFILDCLEKTGENAIKEIGNQGGYFLTLKGVGNAPYYLQGEKESVPSKEEIESEISLFVREELSYCILNFKDFRTQFDEIEHEVKSVETNILEDGVKVTLDYPVTLSKGESVSVIKDFSLTIPVRVNDYYLVSQEIVATHKTNPGSICLSCLYDWGKEYNVYIDLMDYGEATIFTIMDKDESKEAYEWRFAIK